MDKLKKLKGILKKMGSAVVAYSAGVDSTLLLKVCSDVLGKKGCLAVTANSPTYPAEELKFSKMMAKALGVRHKVIKTFELKDRRFISNPINRCYFCKGELFSRLREIARSNSLDFVVDGTCVSDKSDFRPGNKAKMELGIRSPLLEAGFTKDDIRRLSRRMSLRTWDKPSLACLASRIPYGSRISSGLLKRINRGESYLREMGFKQVRLRHHNSSCRIEVSKDELPRLIGKRIQVVDKFKKLGYNYVTLDLEGYRTGSMNLALPKKLRHSALIGIAPVLCLYTRGRLG